MAYSYRRPRVAFWLALAFFVSGFLVLFNYLKIPFEIPHLGSSKYMYTVLFFLAFWLHLGIWSLGPSWQPKEVSEEEQRRRRIKEKSVPRKKRRYKGVIRTDIGIVKKEFLEWRKKRKWNFLKPITTAEIREHNFHCRKCQWELSVALPWGCRHCRQYHEDMPWHTIFDGCSKCGIHPEKFFCPFCNELMMIPDLLPKPIPKPVKAPEPVKVEEPPFIPAGVPFKQRFAHTLIIARPGWGKTQLMQRLAYYDLQAHSSVIVVDSQGEGKGKFLDNILRLRDKGDVIYVDFTDPVHIPCLSMFDVKLSSDPKERERILNGTLELYNYVFSSLLGATLTMRQRTMLSMLSRLMIEIRGANLLTLYECIKNPNAFRVEMQRLGGAALEYFNSEFQDKKMKEVKEQVSDRIYGIMGNTVLERIFTQSESKIDLYKAINSGKTIVVNTSVSHLGADNSSMLGRFFIVMLFQAALRRSGEPGTNKPAFLYIDEAWQYFDEKLPELYAMARKFDLGLVIASQYIAQFTDKSPVLRSAAFSSALVFSGQVSDKEDREMIGELGLSKDMTTKSLRKEEDTTGKPLASEFYFRSEGQRGKVVKIPFYVMENAPKISEEEFREMLEENKARYCERVRVKGAKTQTASADETVLEPDERGVFRPVGIPKIDDRDNFWNK